MDSSKAQQPEKKRVFVGEQHNYQWNCKLRPTSKPPNLDAHASTQCFIADKHVITKNQKRVMDQHQKRHRAKKRTHHVSNSQQTTQQQNLAITDHKTQLKQSHTILHVFHCLNSARISNSQCNKEIWPHTLLLLPATVSVSVAVLLSAAVRLWVRL